MQIRREYEKLCVLVGMDAVPLDLYTYSPETPGRTTEHGTSFANGDPAYSGTLRLIVLPVDRDPERQLDDTGFPPTDFHKNGNCWPSWRIELWHEVVHQVSDTVFGKWNPKEPGRVRPDGTLSERGHGEGWYVGLEYLATKVEVEPEVLESLLNR